MELNQKKSNLNQIKPITYTIGADNQIIIGDVKIKDLVKKYGTPLYVLCEETLRARMQAYESTFKKYYPNHLTLYASKAFNCKAMCKMVEQEGLGIDVVSAGELYTAISTGFPKHKIYFHGNNKSRQELAMAIHSQIGAIVLDNFYELSIIEELLRSTDIQDKRLTVNLLARITPGIECHTHEYIKTGSVDSKFGFNLEDLELLIEKIVGNSKLKLCGLHAHIGSQIFETVAHEDTARVLVELYKKIKNKFNIEFPDLNVGGGLGIKYLESDDPPEIDTWVKAVITAITENCKKYDISEPRILVEPGRSIVGPAGVTVYSVGNIKNVPGKRKYVALDGGMADNVRPIMYQAKYMAEVDGKQGTQLEKVTLAGKYCESGDILIKDINLPKIDHNDLVIIYATGAYNYSMASNYNRAPKPAVVLVKSGESMVIVERETLDDVISKDVLPERLQG